MGSDWSRLISVDIGIQWVGFTIGALFKTEKNYDLFGSLTFLSMVSLACKNGRVLSNSQKVQALMVLTWASRLGLYLFTRIIRDGEDRRFRKYKQSLPKLFAVWNVQAAWVLVTLAPTLFMLLRQASAEQVASETFSWQHCIGWGLWSTGFIIETVSDHQKTMFRAKPENAGKFIQSGLWSISRHPNYFGEIMLWTGLWLSSNVGTSVSSLFLSALSPLSVALLITRVSGVPLLEASATRRWGSNPDYVNYVRRTAVLIPYLW